MAGEAAKVGERSYRERFGRYYEDFAVGDIYEHRPGRTITQYDNTCVHAAHHEHPSHAFRRGIRQAQRVRRCIVCSPLTVALMVGMSVSDVSQKAIANLGWTDIRLTHPLFAGDTLYAQSEVLDKRESKSRPSAGLVTVKTTGVNQAGVAVCDFKRTILVMKRGSDLEAKANY